MLNANYLEAICFQILKLGICGCARIHTLEPLASRLKLLGVIYSVASRWHTLYRFPLWICKQLCHKILNQEYIVYIILSD